MCGIYGTTGYYDDPTLVVKLGKMGFRGPDHSAFQRYGAVTMGHNRLAIIDLDPRSNQPFIYQQLMIVFNGEIYNYRSLREDLTKYGHRFTTDSDTEVIVAAYLQYGESCVQYFNGMFAFVIYDPKSRSLFGARDRLGKKPFYYRHAGNDFEFASQPGALVHNKTLTTDTEAIRKFFVWGYIPEPASAWCEIKKLPAGYAFHYDIDKCILKTKQYWDLPIEKAVPFQGDYQQAKSMLATLLTNAVGIRMHADVSLGIFLSGGIDSSLVAATAARHSGKIKTFCVRFKDKSFDESSHAAMVASYLQTDHHSVDCDASEGITLIDTFGRYYDEPFADPSAIPSLLLSKYAKTLVTVALTGDGGDESFWGYTRYRWLSQANKLFKCPLVFRRLLSSIIHLSHNDRHRLIAEGIRIPEISTLYALMLGGLDYQWLDEPAAGLSVPSMDIWSAKGVSFLQKMAAFDIKTYLNGDINTKIDRATMAFGIEARSPLMDYRVVTFAQSLPVKYKFDGHEQKKILKDLLYESVPKAYFDRPKRGFAVPLKHWFRNELKDYVLDELSLSSLKNIPGIDAEKALSMIHEHLSGNCNRSLQIWKLLIFKQWQQNQCLQARVSEQPTLITPGGSLL